ncbi:major facilitator transporter [Saccharomonospora azurea SZMC 14600]|nr:major facilitator transporter [Saccharomonospora azurea SZMC 14600]
MLVNVGDGIRLAAFPLLAASLTDSAAWVSVVTAASTVPWLVAGLAAGSLADRRGARGLMVTADAVRLAVLVGLAVLVAVGAAGVAIVAVAALLLGVRRHCATPPRRRRFLAWCPPRCSNARTAGWWPARSRATSSSARCSGVCCSGSVRPCRSWRTARRRCWRSRRC